jgi:hypothetical protein
MRGERRRGLATGGPPGVDDHVVGDAGVDGVMQAEADDTVIVRVERPGGVFAQHGTEGIDERLPAPARLWRLRAPGSEPASPGWDVLPDPSWPAVA